MRVLYGCKYGVKDSFSGVIRGWRKKGVLVVKVDEDWGLFLMCKKMKRKGNVDMEGGRIEMKRVGLRMEMGDRKKSVLGCYVRG